jgi:hypothetical protein
MGLSGYGLPAAQDGNAFAGLYFADQGGQLMIVYPQLHLSHRGFP